jgi:hypothetical protein
MTARDSELKLDQMHTAGCDLVGVVDVCVHGDSPRLTGPVRTPNRRFIELGSDPLSDPCSDPTPHPIANPNCEVESAGDWGALRPDGVALGPGHRPPIGEGQ